LSFQRLIHQVRNFGRTTETVTDSAAADKVHRFNLPKAVENTYKHLLALMTDLSVFETDSQRGKTR